MKNAKKPDRRVVEVSQETISVRVRSNRSWKDMHGDFRATIKVLLGVNKVEEMTTAALKRLHMQANAQAYEMYIQCDGDDRRNIARAEELVGTLGSREKFWNAIVKRTGVSKAQASKVVRVFEIAKAKGVSALEFADFVKSKGGINRCLNLRNSKGKEAGKLKKVRSGIKLVGDEAIIRAVTASERSILARMSYDFDAGTVTISKVFDEGWKATRKVTAPIGESDDDCSGEAEETEEEETDEEGFDEDAEPDDGDKADISAEWEEEDAHRLNLHD